MTDVDALLSALRAGEQRAVARAISVVEDRRAGYDALLSGLAGTTGPATLVGVTGSPGVGKSTLVDAMIRAHRDRGRTVGVIAVDPSSPFTGGALLGDRVRMRTAASDDGVFVRSMSARGARGGLAAATLDAVTVLAAAGTDVVIIETVGTGQSEVDIVGTADSVVVVTQPGSGDDVQALKAGILEIGDVYVVNKADMAGVDRTVRDLREMIEGATDLGSHRAGDPGGWVPPVVETVATEGTGVADLLEALEAHATHLESADLRPAIRRQRHAEALRTHLAAELKARVDAIIEANGGMADLVNALDAGETTPHDLAVDLLDAASAEVEWSDEPTER